MVVRTLVSHFWSCNCIPLGPGSRPGKLRAADESVARRIERIIHKAIITFELRIRALLRSLDRWHAWFYSCRDPHGERLIAILHTWKARDNSVDWDEPFARVPTEGVKPYPRQDIRHADPAHRPTQAQYDRFIWLVQRFRRLGWDNRLLHVSPSEGFAVSLLPAFAPLLSGSLNAGCRCISSAVVAFFLLAALRAADSAFGTRSRLRFSVVIQSTTVLSV